MDERCPLCERPLVAGPSVDRHHLIPRSQGGKDVVVMHRVCHRKIHSLWTEKQLARDYASVDALRRAPELQAFLKWIAKKPPEFYARTYTAKSKR